MHRSLTPTALDELKRLRRLGAVSLAETTTLLLLVGVAVPLKHLAGMPQGVRVMGPVHGLVFLSCLWCVIETAAAGDWRPADVTRLVVGALVPFGGLASAALARRRLAALPADDGRHALPLDQWRAQRRSAVLCGPIASAGRRRPAGWGKKRAVLIAFNRRFTTPALLLALAAGLTLALAGHWFQDLWLQLKLGCVLALFALHGVLSGRLHRADARPFGIAPVVTILTALLTAIAPLVTLCPA